MTGSVIGQVFDVIIGGFGGAAAGGLLGHGLQEGLNWLSDRDPSTKAKLPPRIVGSIPTKVHGFVGRKEILNRLETFLGQRCSGVYTLHGLGGCGKSATLLKFLDDASLLETRPSRRSPDAVFVWSFYKPNDIPQFFSELTAYLTPLLIKLRHKADNAISQQIANPMLLSDHLHHAEKKVVLILDGLERIQEEKQTGHAARGAINNPSLRALLQRAAENRCGHTKIIITSRLLVPELQEDIGDCVLVSDLNHLTDDDAVQILKKNGVKGTNEELLQTVREYEHHAYSIYLLARTLAEEFRGDVRRRDRIPELGLEERGPMARILSWYYEKLSPSHLHVMQVISTFRVPVTLDYVHGLLPSVVRSSNPAPEVPSSVRTSAIVRELCELGLVFRDKMEPASEPIYDLHPIVRDFFYRSLLNPTTAHIKAWELLSARQPGYKPTQASEIQLLVEIIYHAIRSGRDDEAWLIYRDRLGGYSYLGTQRADHPVGSKLIHIFLDGDLSRVSHLSVDQLARLFIDGALYLKNEGRLEDAIDLLRSGALKVESIRGKSNEYISLLLNLSGIELLRGRVGDAVGSARRGKAEFESLSQAMDLAISAQSLDVDEELLVAQARFAKECDSRLASALSVTGDPEAIALFERTATIPDSPKAAPREYAAVRHGWLLAQMGRYDEARSILQRSLVFAESLNASMIVQRIKAQLAFVEIGARNIDKAAVLIDEISRWATRSDLHMFIQSWVARASLALHSGHSSRAREIAMEGLRHAGDNGFTLEWLDQQVLAAHASLALNDTEAAIHHARAALNGDSGGFMYAIPGASHPSVRYVWAEAAARYIVARALKRNTIAARGDAASELSAARELMEKVGHPMLSEVVKEMQN